MYRSLSAVILSASLLLTACTEPAPPTLSLYRAVHTGDLDQVKRHLYWKTDVNRADANGDFPLHVAARDGRVRIARELVEHGADPTARDAAGETPMEVALDNGKTQVAQMLIEHRAPFDPQSLLIKVVRQGISDRDTFELLTRRGADLDHADTSGNTPLTLAIERNHLATVERLIMMGADVNRPDAKGRLPLALALEQPRQRRDEGTIVDLLERNGAQAGQATQTQRKTE